MVLACLYVSFDISFLYSIRVINLLTNYLEEWNNLINKMNDELEYDESCKNFFEVYQNILNSFKLF